jgi:hypothetical protein
LFNDSSFSLRPEKSVFYRSAVTAGVRRVADKLFALFDVSG